MVSLCIPTNGVDEVFDVLDSIYIQDIDEHKYEVIITDNGDNIEFEQKIKRYKQTHSNLIYKKTKAPLFLNQMEAFKLANGEFIKFINHRALLNNGSINYIINIVENNRVTKPIIYFLNGEGKNIEINEEYSSFDKFIRNLSYWSSWSSGVSCWKSDFDEIRSVEKYNKLFPHIELLFHWGNRKPYVIDNCCLFRVPKYKLTQKGKYNFFYAFAVEYPSILLDLLRNGEISISTFKIVRREIGYFLADAYIDFIVRKIPTSYILDGYKDYIRVFYSMKELIFYVILSIPIRIKDKIIRQIKVRGDFV